jgi:phenylacetate-CoA ligase
MCAAGISFYRGLTLLGANSARAGILPLDTQKSCLELLNPTVLVGVPSYLNKLGKDLASKGYDTANSAVTKIFCTGEAVYSQGMGQNHIARELESRWGAQAFSVYTNPELSVSLSDCSYRSGLHNRPELVYSEIINEKGFAVPDGTPGELVVTPLGSEAMPLERYKTGDITFKIPGSCECGRNSSRIGPILGRKSQLIKVNEEFVFPLAVTNALDELEEILDYIIILETESPRSDRVSVHVAAPSNKIEKISNQLRSMANVSLPILISNVSTIQSMRGSSRKKDRILDWRPQMHRE